MHRFGFDFVAVDALKRIELHNRGSRQCRINLNQQWIDKLLKGEVYEVMIVFLLVKTHNPFFFWALNLVWILFCNSGLTYWPRGVATPLGTSWICRRQDPRVPCWSRMWSSQTRWPTLIVSESQRESCTPKGPVSVEEPPQPSLQRLF